MPKKSPEILFVGGYGRSGSTILDLLLDRVPGITAVGEFRHLFGRALGDNELCSCGQPFRDCPFWSQVLKRAFPEGCDRLAIQSAVQRFNKISRTWQLLHPAFITSRLRREANIYRDAFTAAYEAVGDLTEATVIVDSSKYPLHGLFIRRCTSLTLKTMLLVRDPRAVAYSWQRRRLRPEVHWEAREMPRHSVIRSALAWNLSNRLTRLIGQPGRDLRIQRYEDFVDKPLESLNDIASFALGQSVRLNKSIFEQQPHVPHTIAGNPVRIGSEHIIVKHDDVWEQRLVWYKKLAVTLCCAWQMRRYHYPWFPGRHAHKDEHSASLSQAN